MRALHKIGVVIWLACLGAHAEEATVDVDFSVPTGKLRALHGVNKGPLEPGGIFNVAAEQKELGIPFTRLHDCGWPNPYVVDHHAVFPNSDADPTKPESYDFRLTDEYIAAVRATGSEPIYRLGRRGIRGRRPLRRARREHQPARRGGRSGQYDRAA